MSFANFEIRSTWKVVGIAKLPYDLCLLIAQVITEDAWEIDKLLKILKLEVREISEGTKDHDLQFFNTSYIM